MPAIFLIVTFGASLVCFLLYVALNALMMYGAWQAKGGNEASNPLDPDNPMYVQTMVLAGYAIIYILIHLGVLLGAIQMARLRSYWLCLLAALLAAVPLLSAFLLLGVPIGIWAFGVLCKRDARQEFRDAKAVRRGEIVMAK